MWWLQTLNTIFFFSFLLFAYFNLNDKDSWLWVPIYVLAAVLCGLAVFHRYFGTLYLWAIGFYLSYAVALFFVKDGVLDWVTKYNRQSIVESMQATKPYIEKTREFFGLLIISTALGLNYWMNT
ncbi:transmembrane 220 family protein [Olivibacter sp. CPCC 100613]|uniref:transmembrane 220 family protein n=1 Tax=Olivibacter sp. CPCC 100613 TaxID=3079931 RepID=UPI002FF76BF3